MGYKEALEDKIRMVIGNKRIGTTIYYPLCHKCNNEVPTYSYLRDSKYTCNMCKISNKLEDKENRIENNKEVKERKLNNAIERIKKVTRNFKQYEKAIEEIKTYLHKDKWFESTEEIMVAIELLKNSIKFRHQAKMGIYRVDFVLDNEKIILEVDGKIFHTKETKTREKLRDNLIIFSHGPDWEIIRITDELINQNITKLVQAIKKVTDRRKSMRVINNGILPSWYSDREVINK